MDILLHIVRSFFGTVVRQWPDLIGTFYGVLLGGLATLGIVRWQIGEERRQRERRDHEFLELLIEHVNREIAKNLRTLSDMAAALGRSDRPRIELWDWAVTIAESFTSQAHDDLHRTGFQRYLPSGLAEEIRAANAVVFEVRHSVRQARAHHIFNAAYVADGESLNEALFERVRSELPGWLAALERADRAVDPRNLPWVMAAVQTGGRLRRRGWLARRRRNAQPAAEIDEARMAVERHE